MLKYEVAVHPQTGQIVWVFGSIPGAIHDITIARERFLYNLLPDEKVWADKGYRGENCFILPQVGKLASLSPAQRIYNQWHSQHHFQHIERINRRIKVWGVARLTWRHSLDKHQQAFLAICRIVNIDLIAHPIWAE